MWPPNPSRFPAVCRLFLEARRPSLPPACRRSNGGRRRGILVISPIAVAPAALAVGGPAWPPPGLHRAWQLGLWSYREARQQQGRPPFGVSVGWAWSSGPWCFARRASTGPWAGGRLLTAMYMAPAVGWALPWHLSCLRAGSATAKPPLLPLPSAKGRPAHYIDSILHQLLEWASTIEQRSNIKTWFRASKRDLCAGPQTSPGRRIELRGIRTRECRNEGLGWLLYIH